MVDTSQHIAQKLWNDCDVLPNDGVSYGDYESKPAEKLLGSIKAEKAKRQAEQKAKKSIKKE